MIPFTEARIGSLRPRAGVAASASEAAGGEFEGGLEHWSAVTKMHHSVRGRGTQGSAFRCSPGTPPGPLREAPGVLPGARSSALSALFLGARGARRVLFQRRARSSSLPPALARSLSLLGKSLSGVFCSGAARAAAHQGASRRARHARAMRTAASQLGKRCSKRQFSHPGVWVPARRSFRCMLLRYIYLYNLRNGPPYWHQ